MEMESRAAGDSLSVSLLSLAELPENALYTGAGGAV
jgi:hypothetical protein